MPRQVRIEFAGAVYHVMCRGDRKEDIFSDAHDRATFLRTLNEVSTRHGWLIHAYVLINNHYHLLLETPEPNLVKGMAWFQTTYTVRYNTRHKKTGHLFGGRYKAVLVDADGTEYFRTLVDYIHLNPVRAGLVKTNRGERAMDFPWSSLGAYLEKPTKRPRFLHTKRAFQVHGLKDSPAGRKKFVDLVEERARAERTGECGLAKIDSQSLQSTLRRGWYYGSTSFREHLLDVGSQLLEKRTKESGTNYQGPEISAHGEKRAETIVQAGIRSMKIAEEDLEHLKKHAYEKCVIAWKVRQVTGMPLKWIAERLHMGSPQNVSRATSIVNDRLNKGDRTLKRTLKNLDVQCFS